MALTAVEQVNVSITKHTVRTTAAKMQKCEYITDRPTVVNETRALQTTVD